jgi:hypothetical protein
LVPLLRGGLVYGVRSNGPDNRAGNGDDLDCVSKMP